MTVMKRLTIGFGIRKLLNDNTLLLGANTFYDHQLTESSQKSWSRC